MTGWRVAMDEALYGAAGFYRRPEGAAGHFRTSAHTGPLFATAILALVRRVDTALAHPTELDLVDVGAGRGELLTEVLGQAEPDLRSRLRLTAVEVTDRPAGLPGEIGWQRDVPAVHGLLVANEWLDVIPVQVVERTATGHSVVLVDEAGAEWRGPPPEPPDLAWLHRWWPLAAAGQRAEVGLDRDLAWAGAVRQVQAGAALAIDYGHEAGGRPTAGTLLGYRGGRAVVPVPDGSCDLTAHVALDAVAAATGEPAWRCTQRAALRELGLSGRRPDVALAAARPDDYLRALRAAGQAAELLDPAGLGGFGWLLQVAGIDVPLSSMSRVRSP